LFYATVHAASDNGSLTLVLVAGVFSLVNAIITVILSSILSREKHQKARKRRPPRKAKARKNHPPPSDRAANHNAIRGGGRDAGSGGASGDIEQRPDDTNPRPL
jgi:hypothetical protein